VSTEKHLHTAIEKVVDCRDSPHVIQAVSQLRGLCRQKNCVKIDRKYDRNHSVYWVLIYGIAA
jgi:hypothetical protein